MQQDRYFLTTSRLGFSKWQPGDTANAIKLWGDPEVTKYIDARGKLTDEQALERLYIELAIEKKYGVQYWPLFLLDTSVFIGCCGTRPYYGDESIYSFGFHICPEYWRNGYTYEAAVAALAYIKEVICMKYMTAGHHPDNVVSRHLLLKLGFRHIRNELYPPTGLEHPLYERWL